LARLYADTSFYVALLIRSDGLAREARRLAQRHTNDQIYTSEPVLVEIFAHVTRANQHVKREALGLVDDLRNDPLVEIIPQTPELFNDGIELYRRRLDHEYSLTDCMSMSICKRLGISDVLTHDNHFAQEGFTLLL
jgi:predicted nucleic acid-binding protein